MTGETPRLELDTDGRAWWRLGDRRWPVLAGGDDGDDGDAGKGDTGKAGDAGDTGKAGDAGGKGDTGDAGAGDTGEETGDAKARREAARYRTELRQAQARITELEAAGKSELERTQGERDAAKAEAEGFKGELGNLRVEVAVMRRASTFGILDADAAARLLDRELLEEGDNGAPTAKSMDAALRALVKDKPYLARAGGGDGGGGGGDDRGSSSPNDALRSAIAKRKGIAVS